MVGREYKKKVLALLAREWDMTGPPGIMDMPDVVACLPMAPTKTLNAVRELFAEGLVDMNTFKTAVFLTPEGYEAACRDKACSD